MPSRRETYKPTLAPVSGQLVECVLCGILVKYHAGDFARHLSVFHQLTPDVYYLTYIAPGAEWCMCGCGEKVTWTSHTGGRFPDFIRGHHLNANRIIKERITTYLSEPPTTTPIKPLNDPGSALPDCTEIHSGFMTLKKGLYVSTKTDICHSYHSKRDLEFMIALDTSEIWCDSWDKCTVVVPYEKLYSNKKYRKRPSYVITRDGIDYYLTLCQSYRTLDNSTITFCDITSMVTGCPAALVAFQQNQKRWFIVWSTVEFTL